MYTVRTLFCIILLKFSGRGYLEKFKLNAHGEKTFLMSAEHVKAFQDQEMLTPEWMGKVKKYVIEVQKDLIKDKEMVFMVESQIFFTYTTPSRELCVLVSCYRMGVLSYVSLKIL